MEKFSPDQNPEAFEASLKEALKRAWQAASETDHYDAKLAELRALRKGRSRHISSEKESRYQALEKEISRCEVVVHNIMEYKILLGLIDIPQEQIDETLNHENAHANVAEQLETTDLDGFRVRFHKKENSDQIQLTPSAIIGSTLSFPEKQRLKDDIKVIEAPAHYGSSLSDSDEHAIAQLKKRLSELEGN